MPVYKAPACWTNKSFIHLFFKPTIFNMNITTRGYVVIAIVIALILGGTYYEVKQKYGKQLSEVKEKTQQKAALGSAHIYKIGINTWPGWSGGLTANKGYDANAESEFFKKYGFAVEFKLIDKLEDSRAAFKSGDVDLLWCTADALPNEEGTGVGLAADNIDAKYFFQCDWSRGGDAMVVTKNINNVSDLKGKSIAFAIMSPSHSLLINTLDAAGLKMSDVTLVKAADAIDAAGMFKDGKVDAAVVWSPDDQDCITTVDGAKVLVSTANATNIIADGFLVKSAFLAEHKDDLTKLVTLWLQENAKINTDDAEKHLAAKILAPGMKVDETWVYNGLAKVRLATIGDNRQFFGLDLGAPVTAPQLYTRMAAIYKDLDYVKDPRPWKNVGDASVVSAIAYSGGSDKPEGEATFAAPTKDVIAQPATASKPITINFGTGVFALDNAAKNTLDYDFAPNAKQFSRNAYIRIEGNTDATGDRATNIKLSKQRATAVKNYLIASYHWDENRFIVVGNGPDKPLCKDGTGEDCYSQNRRTDFELVFDKTTAPDVKPLPKTAPASK
jgi:NitT/TauT family transport system substrate-binding protein